jgi:hypothetical protein
VTHPGERLRALAARLFDRSTNKRLIDPVIADLQFEHAEALRDGRVWRSRWIAITGWIAFWKVAVHAWVETQWRAARAVAIALSAAMLLTASAVLVVLANTPATAGSQGKMAWMILYLLPQALAVSLPICLSLGLFVWLRAERVERSQQGAVLVLMRLALLLGVVNTGWIAPAANNAYRNIVAGRATMRGANELTFIELGSRVYQESPGARIDGPLPMTFWMNARLALAIAPLLLGVLALVGASTQRRRSGVIVVLTTLTVFAGCYLLFPESDIAMLMRWLPAIAIAWIPDAIVAVAIVTLARSTHEKSGRLGSVRC